MNLHFCIARFFARDTKALHIFAAFVSLAVVGCAGTNVPAGSSVANPASQFVASARSTAQATGNFGSQGAMRRGPALRVKPDTASYLRALYIADLSNNNVKILTNTYYRELGAIINGVSGPGNLAMDQLGNLYVANGSNVAEYALRGTSPSYTYSANMLGPSDVAVDRHGNVYAAGQTGGYYDNVNEYFQGVNAVSQSCAIGLLTAVAVDASGDVFAGTANGLYEYIGGLSGCSPTFLMSGDPNKIVLDSNNNLIVSDFGTGTVEVIDPPYTSVSRTLGSGFSRPWGVSLNKKNKLVYVADPTNDTVTVINYATGQNVKVLSGASYGIAKPFGVVDAPNAVY